MARPEEQAATVPGAAAFERKQGAGQLGVGARIALRPEVVTR